MVLIKPLNYKKDIKRLHQSNSVIESKTMTMKIKVPLGLENISVPVYLTTPLQTAPHHPNPSTPLPRQNNLAWRGGQTFIQQSTYQNRVKSLCWVTTRPLVSFTSRFSVDLTIQLNTLDTWRSQTQSVKLFHFGFPTYHVSLQQCVYSKWLTLFLNQQKVALELNTLGVSI